MSEAHEGMDVAGDETLLEDGEQVTTVTVEITKNLQVRAWRAKILKGVYIKDLIRKGLDSELKRLTL